MTHRVPFQPLTFCDSVTLAPAKMLRKKRIRAHINNPYHVHVCTLSAPNHPSSQGFQKSSAIPSPPASLNESFAYHPSANRFRLLPGEQRSWLKTWRSVSWSTAIYTRRLLLWTASDHAVQMSVRGPLPPLPEWWARGSPLPPPGAASSDPQGLSPPRLPTFTTAAVQ